MRMEEIAVFGRSAIMEILRIKEKGQINYDDLMNIKLEHNCIMNLCHPMHASNFVEAGCMDFLDGYEHYHSGVGTFDRTFALPEEFIRLSPLSNSDAHHTSGLYFGWNETTVPIYTEEDLIDYIKTGQQLISWCHGSAVACDGDTTGYPPLEKRR